MNEPPDKGTKESKDRIAWTEWVQWIIFALLSFVSARFILEMIGLMFLIPMIGIAFGYWRRVGLTVLMVLSISWVIFFALPFDIAIRNSTKFDIRIVKVFVATLETSSGVREIEQRGMKKNVDFIIYRRAGIPIPPHYALLITIPCKHRLSTPLIDNVLFKKSRPSETNMKIIPNAENSSTEEGSK